MNNELIERIDHCLKYHHVPPLLSKVLISCKAALTQQQEAEPVAWILTGTDRDLVPRRYLLFSGREAELHVAQNLAGGEWQSCAAKPLYLHPPKPAAQTDGWDAEAYKSACDGLEHWRARAEAAEQALERIRDDLGPTHMGEPVIPQWAGWACQYPGKLPRLYGAREIAEVNCDRENGDTLIYLQSSAAHQVDDRPVIDCKHCGGFGEIAGEYPGVVCPVCNGACVDAPAAQPVTMDDAIAAGNGTLHGAIDYWQQRALKAEAAQQQVPDQFSSTDSLTDESGSLRVKQGTVLVDSTGVRWIVLPSDDSYHLADSVMKIGKNEGPKHVCRMNFPVVVSQDDNY